MATSTKTRTTKATASGKAPEPKKEIVINNPEGLPSAKQVSLLGFLLTKHGIGYEKREDMPVTKADYATEISGIIEDFGR